MKYLLWDETRADMLACPWFGTCLATRPGTLKQAVIAEQGHGEIPDELPPPLPPCPGRIGPGGRGFIGYRRRAGAIADASASRCQYACAGKPRNSRPGSLRQPDPVG